jgi:putative ABC transport system permease protein
MVILGLAAAFTVFATTVIQCRYDFSYNGNFEDTDDVYLYVRTNGKVSGNYTGSYLGIQGIETMKQTYPDIIDICSVNRWDSRTQLLYYSIEKDGKELRFEDNKRIGISDGFFSFFKPETIAGDAAKLFIEPNRIIITASYAKKLFGNENPVGKTLKMENQDRPDFEPLYTVVAVWEDFPDNCSLQNGVYYNLKDSPEQGDNFVLMKIVKSNKSDLLKRMTQGEHIPTDELELLKMFYKSMSYNLIPFDEIHFSELGEGNPATTLSLLFVGIIALAVAYINFINFSIAISPTRVKSLNIQKIFGADTRLLRLITASEPAIFSTVAFLISVFFINMINSNIDLRHFFAADMSPASNLQLLTAVGFFTVIAGFAAGLYPAYYVTSFSPALTLSGSPTKSRKNVRIRNGLTFIQFTVGITLITVVVFMKQQHDYAVNYSYGIQKENIVYLPISKIKENTQAFIAELKKNPKILDCTASKGLIGSSRSEMEAGNSIWPALEERQTSDIQANFTGLRVADNFLAFFGIPVIEGNDFPDAGHGEKAIINRKLKEVSGQTGVTGKRLKSFEIAGVIDNVNFEDLHHPVAPMALIVTESYWLDCLYVKITGDDIPKTVSWIKNEVWTKFCSLPVEINFLDTHLKNRYKRENDLANLLTAVCIITVIIVIMGVYGQIVFNIRQKEREIALRKIAGATVWDVLLLLNRGALVQLITAFTIACPLAYYITNRWLETFAYTISVRWWVFVLCWLFMCAVTVATTCMQTYRAATANPIKALKTE